MFVSHLMYMMMGVIPQRLSTLMSQNPFEAIAMRCLVDGEHVCSGVPPGNLIDLTEGWVVLCIVSRREMSVQPDGRH